LSARAINQEIEVFRGLNDRVHLPRLGGGEFPDALNVELSQRAAEKRGGFTRLGSAPLKGTSLRLDGANDYLRIKRLAAYDPSFGANINFYLTINVVLHSRPVSGTPRTLLSWGYGGGATHVVDIRYDSTAGTGSNGAWVARIRDAFGGGSTVTLTLDFGDGTDSILGQQRHLFLQASASATNLTMLDMNGNSTTVAGAGIGTWPTTTSYDLFVGVGTTSANVIGSDFIDATVAELRIINSVTQTSDWASDASGRFNYKRELNDAGVAFCDGYWKLNDGGLSPSCRDYSTNANHAIIVNNPATWLLKSDESDVLGESAVQFLGGNSWVSLNATGTQIASTFAATSPNVSRWTVRGIIILPALPAGSTTWPDGVIFWAGTNTTTPAPLGFRTVSDAFEAKYDDAGTVRTLTLSGGSFPAVSTLAGKRIRYALYRTGSGTGSFVLGIAIDNGDGTVTTHFTAIACTGANAGSTSSDWAMGRHVTNFATARLGDQTAFHTDGAFYGAIDDFQIIHTNQLLVPVGLGGAAGAGTTIAPQLFQEVSSYGGSPAANTLHLYLKFNEGGGNFLESIGSVSSDSWGGWRCYLLPETDSGASWDTGLVEPYRPQRGVGVFPYNRFLADGTRARSLLLATGTTLSAYDAVNGVQVVGRLPGRCDALTFAQYGQRVIIAGAVGRRPVVYDGGSIKNLGVRAPFAASVVTVANSTGTFVAGTYYLYVTYRSVHGADIVESNPGPGVLVTFAAGADTITAVTLPISSDPQVNQRRIWMTGVSGADGAVAYLVATVNDNSTSSYTTAIEGPVSTSAATLEYFENEEAPDGTVVGQFLDYTLLGGNQRNPTRLYFSSVGAPDYWNTQIDGRYLDLDLDSGDPILAIAPLLDRAIVDVGDGKWAVYATGDTAAPLGKSRINDTHGAVGPQAALVTNNQEWYIGETDFYVSDGYRENNITSPEEPPATAPVYIQQQGKTSIQNLLRNKIDWSQRAKFCVLEHRSRSQIWFGVRMTDGPAWNTDTNTHTLVYDVVQGFWTRYDIPLDCGILAEIASEKAEPVGIVQGWPVKLDQATGDGATASAVLTVTAKTAATTGALLEFSGTPFSGLEYRHLRAFVYHKSDNSIQEHRITGVPATNQLLLDSNDTTVAIGDLVIVAAAPYYFDVVPYFGDIASSKTLLGGTLAVEMTSAAATMRLQHKADVRTVPSTLSGFTSRTLALSSAIIARWQGLGGFGTNFYIRVSETGYALGTGTGVFPGGGAFRVYKISLEGSIKRVRSRG